MNKQLALLALLWACVFALPPLLHAGDDDSWTSNDKYMHFGVSFVIESAGYWTAREGLAMDKSWSLGLAAAGTVAVGAVKEWTDEKFDWKDLAWDVAGAALGTVVWMAADRRHHVRAAAGRDRITAVYVFAF